METKKIALWSVFFLVPTGRGKIADLLSADEFEEVFAKLYQVSRRASFHIKTTEAQHYRRYVLQQQVAARRNGAEHVINDTAKVMDTIGRAPRGLNDGKGFVFVSHMGEVFPSGFLPFTAGTVRSDSLSRIYRESPMFQQLHDDSQLGDKCGACEFRHICGGSRARAFALTGDPLAEEVLLFVRAKELCSDGGSFVAMPKADPVASPIARRTGQLSGPDGSGFASRRWFLRNSRNVTFGRMAASTHVITDAEIFAFSSLAVAVLPPNRYSLE